MNQNKNTIERPFIDPAINKISKYKFPRVHSAENNLNDLPIEQVYAISKKQHANWGLKDYPIMKHYEDPLLKVKEREFTSQRKGQKSRFTVTRRGHYLEDLYQLTKGIPGPSQYKIKDEWPQKDKDSVNKIDTSLSKNTFLDQIIYVAKHRGIPGPGAYSLEKDIKKINEEKKEASKHKAHQRQHSRENYLNDIQYVSSTIPGPGSYNPRLPVKLIFVTKDTPDTVRRHHQNLEKKFRGKKLSPGPASYSPNPQHIKEAVWNVKVDPTLVAEKNFMISSAERIPNSKKIIKIPAPGQYQLMARWPGKQQRGDITPKNWMDSVSKGPEFSIYY